MKPKLITLIPLLALALTCSAQQLPIALPPTNSVQQTFFETVSGYFLSFNTNLNTFQTDKGLLWTSADFEDGVNTTFSLGASYRIWRRVSVETVVKNFGIAGAITTAQAGLGLNLTVHDVRVIPYVDYLWNFSSDSADNIHGSGVAIGVRFLKALTSNTYAGIGLEADYMFNRHEQDSVVPILSVIMGIKF